MDDPACLDGAPWRGLGRRAAAVLGGPCEVCRQWSPTPFCGACVGLYGRPVPRCPGCAQPTPDGVLCPSCRNAPGPISRTIVAFDYAFPWDRTILALKFQARTDLAWPLAAAVARALDDTAGDALVDALVPVPLSDARLAERGFNQSLLLARCLSASRGVPVEGGVLQRPVDTAHQAVLSREERVRNLEGAFMIDPRGRPALAGRRIALVDDVVTTGATASAAARELLRGGARAVELWAVARTV